MHWAGDDGEHGDDTGDDQSDDHWAPIEGIDLVEYARLARDLAAAGVAGPAAVEAWVVERGVAPGSWPRVATGWSSRMIRHPELQARYDEVRLGTGATPPP